MPKPMDASSRQRPWISLTLSAVLHAALLVAAVELTHRREQPAAQEHGADTSDPARQVQMVYLEPPPPAAVPPPKRPAPEPPPPAEPRPEPPPPAPTPPRAIAPPPEKAQRTPEPEANAPPEATRSEGEERTADDPTGGERTGADAKRGSPTTSEVAATMESEAKRIFGRPRAGPRPGAGPRAVRPMEAYLPDHPERCIPTERTPSDPAAATQYGVAVGKIFRKDDGRPLSGAHLQMLGTPYVTFTDESGAYRFRFDLALVDNCRTQYVRVTAPGYESRLLVLMVGANVQSEDVLLKRN